MKVASSRIPLRLPLVDVVALHDAVPAAHLLLVAGADPAGGVDVEVAADLAAAEPRAQQQLGRAEGAAGDDHRAPGAHRVGGARRAVRPSPRPADALRRPTARPSSTSSRRASTPARTRAPAATARGR